MSNSSTLGIVLLVVIGIGVGVWLLAYRGKPHFGTTAEQRSESTSAIKNACIFQQSIEAIDSSAELTAAFKVYMARETYGYPHDMPLADALSLFNAELRCNPTWAKLPPLTENEVLANAVAGHDYTEAWSVEKDRALQQVVSGKMMPKGSLFKAESGGCGNSPQAPKRTCADGLKIYLFLGLDKNPRASEQLKPEQIVLIRKTLFGTYTED